MRYLPPIVRDNLSESVVVGSGHAGRCLAWFISVGAIGAKIVAFLLQYVIFRTIGRPAYRYATIRGSTRLRLHTEIAPSCRCRTQGHYPGAGAP